MPLQILDHKLQSFYLIFVTKLQILDHNNLEVCQKTINYLSQMHTKIVANEAQKANVQANNFKVNQGKGVGSLWTTTKVNKQPLFVAFLDFKKAFDSVRRSSIMVHLHKAEIPHAIITILERLYNNVELQLIYGKHILEPI